MSFMAVPAYSTISADGRLARAPPAPNAYDAFGAALRLVGHDMKVSDPLDTGTLNHQVPPG